MALRLKFAAVCAGMFAIACGSSGAKSNTDSQPAESSAQDSNTADNAASDSATADASQSPETAGNCSFAARAADAGLDDGCQAAPAGAPQYPSLLSSYGTARPPWDVAGVDYAIGVPAGIALKDPTSAPPACASYNATTHVVTVTASDCTIDGYDFTQAGGLMLSIPAGIAGTIVRNCAFGLTGNPAFSTGVIDRRGGDLSVESCTFQGEGQDPMYFDTGASGTVTFAYNLFTDIDGDGMDFGSSQTVNVTYNACVKIGMNAAAHPDCVQFCGGVLNAASHESFNLSYQPVGVASTGAQGLQISEQCGGTINGYSADHNAIIAADSTNLTMSYCIYNNGTGVTITDNYIDSTGAYGPFYPAGDATCTGNIALTNAHGYTAGAAITGTFGPMTCN